jgi:long-chain acyl-CoA synthetase
MLKEIRDVEEAMVVGEELPYCAALIWIKRGLDRAGVLADIDQAVAEINTRLSHPEQLKRWITMENTLSVSRGELTATLKIKRTVILDHLSGVVESLYSRHSLNTLDTRMVGVT